MKLFATLMNALHKSLVVFQSLLLGLLLCMVSYQIIARWVVFIPRALWTEEIARFLLVWVIFLGAAIGVKERTHFTLEVLQDSKSRIVNIIWEYFLIAMEFIFCAIFLYRGAKYAAVLLYDVSDVAQISMIWVGASIPVFGVLATIFVVEIFLNKITKGEK